MKKIILFFSLLISISINAQNIPDAVVTDMNGNKVNFKELVSSDKPVIVSFWATWCVPCINELDAISEVYPDWQEETGVKLIAVSRDDDRTARRIKPLVNGKAWDYEVYRDVNDDLKRALNIASIPYMIIIKNGKIVATRSGYTPGSEDEIYEIISK
jgi:thiol-disulfide isomerase/thioredoxin